MLSTFKKLWQDDAGSVIATEYLALAGIVALGGVAGLQSLRDATIAESTELANGIRTINQSYQIDGQQGCGSTVGRSGAVDTATLCNTSASP